MANIGAIVISAQAAMTTSKNAAIPFFAIRIQALQNAGNYPVIPITPSSDQTSGKVPCFKVSEFQGIPNAQVSL
jgi:hypothetical protein